MRVTKKLKKNKPNTRKINIILVIGIILCIGALVFLLLWDNQTLTPDYAPGTIDTNAIKEDDSGKKMDVSEGGGAVSLSYSNVVAINLSNKKVQLYFKNPSKSRENIVLQLIIEQNDKETVIAKSDLIPAGYAIYKLDLENNVKLKKGGYDGIFRITYYNEESGAKEIVDTEIEVSIEVE